MWWLVLAWVLIGAPTSVPRKQSQQKRSGSLIRAQRHWTPDDAPTAAQLGTFMAQGPLVYFAWGDQWHLVEAGAHGPEAPRFCADLDEDRYICLVQEGEAWVWRHEIRTE